MTAKPKRTVHILLTSLILRGARSIATRGGGKHLMLAPRGDFARPAGFAANLLCRAGLRGRARAVRSSSSSDDGPPYLAPTLAGVQQEIRERRRGSERKRKRSFGSSEFAPTATADGRRLRLQQGLVAGRLGLDPLRNTRHAPMVYHDRYSCPGWPVGHTFPMAKFEETAASLQNDLDESQEGGALVLAEEHFYRPVPVEDFPRSFLSPPICPRFLQRFLSGLLSREECRYIGFREQTSRPELVERTILEVAGTVLASQLAMRHGLASNLAGGTHHAERDRGKGYTIVNDLAVTTRLMTWREAEADGTEADDDVNLLREFYRGDAGPVDRVLVVDCDVHQGDGTATFSRPPAGADGAPSRGDPDLRGRLFTLDLHAASNYPHPKAACTYDVGLPDGCGDGAYLSALSSSLGRALDEVRPHLVLYNAGVDVHEFDKLGRLSLSLDGMEKRDLHVIRTCVERRIPVAAVVGGGYDDDVRALGRRHALVHRACARVWRERRMWTGRWKPV